MIPEKQQRMRHGILLAIGAYTIWGIMPIYFKSIAEVPTIEIFCHRIIWSFLLLAALLHFGGRWSFVRDIMVSKTKMLYLVFTTILIGMNWFIFIYAINTNHMLDASLGYYINPLINILFGVIFLKERLGKRQWIPIVLIFCGVLIQLFVFGSVPLIATAIALTFGFYGLLRKKANLDVQAGLFIEILLMLPIAIYLLWIADTPTANLANNSMSLNLRLIFAGVITILPMMCFTGAAIRLKLSTLSFFQYIGPSLMLLLAVLVYGETCTVDQAITFGFIWSALIIFSFNSLSNNKYSGKNLKIK